MGEWKKTQCNFCGLACGLEMEVENNRIINVRPDSESPRTPHTYCCRKGRSSKYFQDSEKRLDYPLKRVGDHFERISWKQAYKEIAERANKIIETYGKRTFAYCGGALANAQGDVAMGKAMTKAIGSQYVYNPAGIEFAGNWWSHGKILGDQGKYLEPDDGKIDVLIFWGSNSYVSHQILESRKVIREFSKDSDKLVIDVDPRMSETARMSDMHIMPKPGCDSLMLRGLIALIIDKGWQNQEFIDKWVSDWEAALIWYRGFDYREAFQVCGLPYSQMEEFARILTTKTWGLHQDLGIFCGRHNTCNSYLLLTLMTITGNILGRGNVILDSFANKGDTDHEESPEVWRTVETGRFPVTGVYPAGVMAQEILSSHPDHLRCLFVSMANPARSWPDTKMVEKALESLDLLVVIDIYMTETAWHADYVLPGKTGFEQCDFTTFQATSEVITCMMKHPIIEQIGERRDNAQIWLDIVKKMGCLPKLPKSLYESAEKAVRENDRLPYLMDFLRYMKNHKEYGHVASLLIVETMGKAMGSANRAMLWAALVTSPMVGSGMAERAGFTPGKKHKILQKVPKLRDVMVMDQVFQAVDDTPQGVIIGYREPDIEKCIKDHIKHADGKIHLWCAQMDAYLRKITPEKEREELKKEANYPMILSAGLHADGGDNTSMRNPATYQYRKPYFLSLNPEDAKELDVEDGEEVRLVTKGGNVKVPVKYTYLAGKGYALIPHHYGLKYGNEKVYGSPVNELTRSEDIDEITGNPLIRYVPCRIEKIRV